MVRRDIGSRQFPRGRGRFCGRVRHRHFKFGGSYDWYWLFEGAKEIGPIGEAASAPAVVKTVEESALGKRSSHTKN